MSDFCKSASPSHPPRHLCDAAAEGLLLLLLCRSQVFAFLGFAPLFHFPLSLPPSLRLIMNLCPPSSSSILPRASDKSRREREAGTKGRKERPAKAHNNLFSLQFSKGSSRENDARRSLGKWMGRSGNKFPAKKALPEFYGIELSLAAGKVLWSFGVACLCEAGPHVQARW